MNASTKTMPATLADTDLRGSLTHWLDSLMAGKLVSLPLVAVNGFVLSRRWIFK